MMPAVTAVVAVQVLYITQTPATHNNSNKNSALPVVIELDSNSDALDTSQAE